MDKDKYFQYALTGEGQELDTSPFVAIIDGLLIGEGGSRLDKESSSSLSEAATEDITLTSEHFWRRESKDWTAS